MCIRDSLNIILVYIKNIGNSAGRAFYRVYIDDSLMCDFVVGGDIPAGSIEMAACPVRTAPDTPGTHFVKAEVGTVGEAASDSKILSYIIKPPTPFGNITRVTLDSELLPEGGTLDWTAGKQAAIKVYFKNVGNAAGEFNIAVAYNGNTICNVRTDSVPADGKEYYVDDCVFTPNATGTHTIKATITP